MMVSLLSSGKFSQKTAEINKPRDKCYCCVTASFPKPNFSQKQKRTSPFTLLAEAARTSASQSFSKFWNAGTKSFLVISGPTAFCNFIQTRKQPELKHPHRDNTDHGQICFLRTHFWELVGHHIAHSPGLVLGCLTQSWHDQGLQILLRQEGCDANAGFYRQQPHWVLKHKV